MALLAFGPEKKLNNTRLTMQVPAFTDNKGNGYVINKLMTTRFPFVHSGDGTGSASRAEGSSYGSRMDSVGPQPGSR